MAKPMFSDKQWARLEPFLPQYFSAGRPWKDNRAVLEGILWVLRTGARWRDLPSGFGVSPATCWRRLRQWDEEGAWLKVWRRFLAELDRRGQLDWSGSSSTGVLLPPKRGRRRPAAPPSQAARHPTDLSTSQEPLQGSHAGRTGVAALPASLESRADLRLAGKLPPPGRAPRAPSLHLQCLLPCRLPPHHPQTLVKPFLG